MDKNFKILEKLHLLLAKELTDKITSGEAKAQKRGSCQSERSSKRS